MRLGRGVDSRIEQLQYRRGRKNSFRFILFLTSVISGLYLINFQFPLFKVPELATKFNIWILFLAGILLFISSFNWLKRR